MYSKRGLIFLFLSNIRYICFLNSILFSIELNVIELLTNLISFIKLNWFTICFVNLCSTVRLESSKVDGISISITKKLVLYSELTIPYAQTASVIIGVLAS